MHQLIIRGEPSAERDFAGSMNRDCSRSCALDLSLAGSGIGNRSCPICRWKNMIQLWDHWTSEQEQGTASSKCIKRSRFQQQKGQLFVLRALCKTVQELINCFGLASCLLTEKNVNNKHISKNSFCSKTPSHEKYKTNKIPVMPYYTVCKIIRLGLFQQPEDKNGRFHVPMTGGLQERQFCPKMILKIEKLISALSGS